MVGVQSSASASDERRDEAGDGTARAARGSLEEEIELRLARARGRLSHNDEQILEFLREHLEELAFHTSESIAQGTGVSRAAVVRFSRRLGYTGFAELREQGRAELQARRGDGDRREGDPAERSLLARKAQRDADGILLLPKLLRTRLQDAAERAARAERLWLVASRETHGLVVYLHRLLHHVRSDVHLIDPGFPDPVRDIAAEDVVLACTFRPYSRQTIDLVKRARSAGATIVVVTDGDGHAFLADTDIVLAVPVESPTMFLSFAPAVSALEALAAYVARVAPDRTYETLNATDAFVDSQRLMLEPMGAAGERKVGPKPRPA